MNYNWTNQYIPLVQEKSGRIFEEESEGFRTNDIAHLKQQREQYSAVVVELGSGSGMHLLNLASTSPETLHIGFELRYKRAYRTIEKAETAGLSNILMVRGDARRINDLFSTGELSALYIHYPDPWRRPRWRKHRLIQPEFVENLSQLLRPGGTLSFRTDHEEYFKSGVEIMKRTSTLSIDSYTEDLVASTQERFIPTSEFESLFASQELPLRACTFIRC